MSDGDEGNGVFEYNGESLQLDEIHIPIIIKGTLSAGTPTIAGTAAAGNVLTASAGNWHPEPDSFAYQWLRNGADIPGATGSTYTVTTGDQASTLAVRVAGKKFGYHDAEATSAGLAIPSPTVIANPPIAAPPLDTPPAAKLRVFKAVTPKIAGTVKVGKTIRVKIVSWKPKPKYSYQWFANGKKIKKATHSTLKLVKSLKGKKITVKVTGKKTGYQTAIKISKATTKVKAKAAR